MDDKLKPCPWCGGDAQVVTTRAENYGYWCEAIGVKCSNCGTIKGSHDVSKWAQGVGHYPIRGIATAFVINLWNTRHQELKSERKDA